MTYKDKLEESSKLGLILAKTSSAVPVKDAPVSKRNYSGSEEPQSSSGPLKLIN